MAECLQDARVWPNDYRRVYGRMIPMGPFSVRGGSDGVVFDGHTRGYAPTVGTPPVHVMFMQSDGVVLDFSRNFR